MHEFNPPDFWEKPFSPSVFLAGGITGCPDWQKLVVSMLKKTSYAVFNPRRENFPIDDPNAAREQITWEFHHLSMADVIAFWFCKETVQPIALFELGAWSTQRKKPIVIGVEPGYPREQDIYIQMELRGRKKDGFASSLPELVEQIRLFEMEIQHWTERENA